MVAVMRVPWTPIGIAAVLLPVSAYVAGTLAGGAEEPRERQVIVVENSSEPTDTPTDEKPRKPRPPRGTATTDPDDDDDDDDDGPEVVRPQVDDDDDDDRDDDDDDRDERDDDRDDD